MNLHAKKIAILIAPRGTEEAEFAKPKAALEELGAAITVVGLQSGAGETVNNDLDPGTKYDVDTTVDAVDAAGFDALVIPGGSVGADKLRASEAVVALVRGFVAASKPVAAICHAPWTLIEAGAADGRTLTSFPSLQTDIRNAGGRWVDEEVVEDRGVITSRNPHDIPAFVAKLAELVAAGEPALASV